MSLWPFGQKAATPTPAPETPPEPSVQAPVGMRTLPPGINIAHQPRIEHAFGRLDAILAHCEQTVRGITPERANEFRSEALQHAANLSASGAISSQEATDHIARIEAAISRAPVRS